MTLELEPQLVAPLSLIVLGLVSFGIRKLAGFPTYEVGADLCLIACSLQIGTTIGATTSDQSSAFFLLVLLGLYVLAILFIQGSRRVAGYASNLLLSISLFLGVFSLLLEIQVIQGVNILG